MESKTTFAATESGPFAAPFVDMPTVRALLRSAPGIHKEKMLPKSLGSVADKLLKLVERPAIELEVKLFSLSLLNLDLAQNVLFLRSCEIVEDLIVHLRQSL